MRTLFILLTLVSVNVMAWNVAKPSCTNNCYVTSRGVIVCNESCV